MWSKYWISFVCKIIKKILKNELIFNFLQPKQESAIIFVCIDSALSQKRFVFIILRSLLKYGANQEKVVRRITGKTKRTCHLWCRSFIFKKTRKSFDWTYFQVNPTDKIWRTTFWKYSVISLWKKAIRMSRKSIILRKYLSTVLQIGFFRKKDIHCKRKAKWEPFMRFYQVI